LGLVSKCSFQPSAICRQEERARAIINRNLEKQLRERFLVPDSWKLMLTAATV
jgi:hypothetical protein